MREKIRNKNIDQVFLI